MVRNARYVPRAAGNLDTDFNMTTGGAALLIGFAATTLVVAVLLLRVRAERRRLNLLINNVADGIVISESAGRVRWANEA